MHSPLSQPELRDLERRSTRVLTHNDRGDHTIPAEGMYPHEWLWDEVFADIGLRHIDPTRAALGLTSLFKGQWNNGMIPNMIFTKGRLFGEPRFKPDYLAWSSHLLNANAPKDVATTGITQPPILAEGIQQVGNYLTNDDRNAFYRDSIGKLVAYHSWIYTDRNPNHNGLFAAVHPWETGMENTPAWMEHMATLDWGVGGKLTGALGHLAQYFRRDTRATHSEERASAQEGILYVNAFTKLLSTRYDAGKLTDTYPLHIEDVHMNSVLIRNNEVLQQLADETDYRLPDDLLENMSATRQNIEELWDEDCGLYLSRDAVTGKTINIPTIASLMPLYAGSIPADRAQRLVAHSTDPNSFGLSYGVPTVPANSPYYREKGYWSGPTWVNMNWLIASGERRLGFEKAANQLTDNTVRMVAYGGMKEYFSAKSGRGLGAKNFSWTAALTIDMICANQK